MMQPFTGDSARINVSSHVETFLNVIRWSNAKRLLTELAEVAGGGL
jgi:hypothetical protein